MNFKRRTFTLMEVVIMTAIGMVLFGGIMKILTQGMRGAQHGMEKMVFLSDLSFFIESIQRNARNATKAEIQSDKITLELSRYSKTMKGHVSIRAIYRVYPGTSNSGGYLEYSPEAVNGVLPADIKPKTFLKGNIVSCNFLQLKDDLSITLPGGVRGFIIDVKIKDAQTNATLNFQRAFFPPLLDENNKEDPYHPLQPY